MVHYAISLKKNLPHTPVFYAKIGKTTFVLFNLTHITKVNTNHFVLGGGSGKGTELAQ